MVEGKVMSPLTDELFYSWSCTRLSSHTLKAQQTSHHRKKPRFMVPSMVFGSLQSSSLSSSYVVNDTLVSGVHCKLYAYGSFSEVITKLRSFRNWSQCSVAKWRHNYFMPGRISIARPSHRFTENLPRIYHETDLSWMVNSSEKRPLFSWMGTSSNFPPAIHLVSPTMLLFDNIGT